MQKYTSTSIEQTQRIAKEIAATLTGRDIVLLKGDLGAGKTTFTKGLLDYFGINKDDVVSPTFTLLQEYSIERNSSIETIAHIDTYRLEHQDDLIEIGVEDYLMDEKTLTIVEWPEKITTLLKNKSTLLIDIAYTSENERTITLIKNS